VYQRELLILLNFTFLASTAEGAVFFFLLDGAGCLRNRRLGLAVRAGRVASTL